MSLPTIPKTTTAFAAEIINILLPINLILLSPPDLIICPQRYKLFVKFKDKPKNWVNYKCEHRVIKKCNIFYF